MDVRNVGVVITGGSRGLGAELAKELARRGARLALVARGEAKLNEVVEELRAAGGDAHAIVADVADKDQVYAIAGIAGSLLGSIDVVVHDASTLGPVPLRTLLETECEDLADVLETNLVGPFRLTKAFVGPMVLRGRGGLVLHMSSDAAVNGYPGWGAYGASKAALDHLARIWAAELADTGVRFLAVDPGDMDTEMHAAALPEADPSTLARPEDVARRIADLIANDDVATGSRVEAVNLLAAR